MPELAHAAPAPAPRERPILFTGPMVRAILEGRKTQTRRPLKQFTDPGAAMLLGLEAGVATFGHSIPDDPVPVTVRCPYGAPGDRLWVRETFWVEHESEFDEARGVSVDWGAHLDDPTTAVQYVATPPNPEDPGRPGAFFGPDEIFPERTWVPWGEGYSLSPRYSKKPGIHMPRWASRLTLEVTDVRIERVQAITEDDARAEGFDSWLGFHKAWNAMYGMDDWQGPFAWYANPWVWVVSFRRVAP